MNVTTRLYPQAALTADQKALLKRWDAVCFLPGSNPFTWSWPPDYSVFTHDVIAGTDQPVSYLGVYQRECSIGGQRTKLGGIGSVMTPPQFRKRGYAGEALKRAAAFMRQDLGLDYALLVTGTYLIPFYNRLGWQHITAPVYFSQPDGSRHTWDGVTMILVMRDQDWPDGEIDLLGLPW